MRNQNASNFAQCVVTILLTAFLVALGWFTLWQGGISLKGKSGHITYVGGGFATAFAIGAFFFAAISALLLGKAFGLGRLAYVVLIALVLLPPVAYLLS
jgi:hypothetical protein